MRIISQDGMYDLPYDMTILTVDENMIVAGVIGEEDVVEMAYYQSHETAMEEMKRLRHSYGLMLNSFFKFKGDMDQMASVVEPLG